MNTVRLINSNELHYIKDLFSIDNRLIGEPVTPEELERMVLGYRRLLDTNAMKIAVMFDENQDAVAMYTARLFTKTRAWWVGTTKIKKPSNHFNISARIMMPALDFLLEEMESMGYYKFWMGAPKMHHDIRNTVMKKYSERLNRYEWFDEYIIPQGERCNVEVWEQNRRTCNWTDILIRMFVLKQEFREPLVLAERERLKNV